MAEVQSKLNTIERTLSTHPDDEERKIEMIKLKTELEVYA